MTDWKENCVSVETNEYKTDVQLHGVFNEKSE